MKRVRINAACNSDTWWLSVADSPPPPSCGTLLKEAQSVMVSDRSAAAFVTWAERFPGWADGPIIVEDIS